MPTSPSTQLQFVYSPEHQRVKQVVTGGAQAGTTYYYNGNDSLDLSYEKTIKANGVTEHKHYISLPGSNGQWLLGQFVQRSGNLAANPASSRAAQELNCLQNKLPPSNKKALAPKQNAEPVLANGNADAYNYSQLKEFYRNLFEPLELTVRVGQLIPTQGKTMSNKKFKDLIKSIKENEILD